MATVIMKRGSNADMANTPSLDGLIFFNSDDKCIYLDNGTTRTVYGGKIPLVTTVSTNDGATDNNTYSARAAKNGFCIKSDVADSAENINNTATAGRPVGCLGFKSIIGTSDISAVDTTVTGSIAKINDRLVLSNNRKFVFDYQNGKWGFNTSDERGADTFHPFNSTILAMNTVVSGYTNNNIVASNIYLTISSTNDAGAGALLADFPYGTCTSAVTSRSYKTSSNKYVKGGIIHAFYDLNDGTTSGNHRHYMYVDNAWRYNTTSNSPISFSTYTHATLGLPFTIPTIDFNINNGYSRDDIVCYYVCYVKDGLPYVDVYKYVPSLTNGYDRGSWSKITTSIVDINHSEANITDFKIGSSSSIVVYHRRLYIIDGNFVVNGINNYINAIYQWSPYSNRITQIAYPSELNNVHIIKALVHNDKIYVFYQSNSNYYYITYNDSTWSESQRFYQFGNLNVDEQSRWVEYNGSIHILGGSVSTNRLQHISLNDSNLNNSSASLDDVMYKYGNLKFPFRNGCVCVTPPVIVSNSDTSEYWENSDEAKYITPQYIHYMGTIQANTSEANYRRMHRKLIDVYQGDICNTYGNIYL